MISDQTEQDALMLAQQGQCPCCKGTGAEDGTGEACGGERCVYCEGAGCGGTCSWCGGSGSLAMWRHGNPSYRGVLPDAMVDLIEKHAPDPLAEHQQAPAVPGIAYPYWAE